jgi:hypothetical protein
MAGGGARIEGLEEETRGLGNGGDGSGRKRRERGSIDRFGLKAPAQPKSEFLVIEFVVPAAYIS